MKQRKKGIKGEGLKAALDQKFLIKILQLKV